MALFRGWYVGKLAIALVAAAVLGAVVMLLWNAVVPVALSAARPIDYPHAVGLLVLSRILFGGFRGHGGWHRHRHWQKWQAMTPEEREQFKHAMQRRRHRGERQ
ncbi:hypothetical protein [Xanthomonas bundabergensis]|uniref:hypothetical protein n=1 Tax=Xanthomonas bundabergensis TaxID=3160842 RepID=UPI00351935AF